MPPGVPLVIHAAALAPALVLLAAALRWRWIRQDAWLLAACLISLAADGLGLALAARGQNNQWLALIAAPAMFAAFLMALGRAQETTVERHAVHLVAGMLVVASTVLALVVETPGNFSQYAVPLGALLVLAVAIRTLVRGGLVGAPGTPGIRRASWVGAPLGLALYSGVTAAYLPFAAAFARANRDLVLAVLQLKSLLVIVAFGLMAWGILWREPTPASGPSLSSSSWRSASS